MQVNLNGRIPLNALYHHIFTGDSDILSLKSLRVSNLLEFRSSKTVMYYRGKFYPFDSINAILYYVAPRLGNKNPFGFVGFCICDFSVHGRNGKVTAEEWMLKYAGEHVYRSMWEPMILGNSVRNMQKLYSEPGRIHSRSTSLGTFRGGFQTFINIFSKSWLRTVWKFVLNRMSHR